jgi:choloylglycine hydrolase
MDWREEMQTSLWALPRGAERVGLADDGNPLTWTAQFGSVVATVWDMAASDGINERGLAAHILWLAETDFGERDQSKPGLTTSVWAQYFLDRFATVAEAVESIENDPFQVRPQVEPRSGEASTVHLALDDAAGDSVIIEYLGGEPRLHHDPGYRVMTNSPPFEEQLTLLQSYEGFGGTKPLPGTTEAADRFVRASYYLDRLPQQETPERAYAALLSVMRNAAQPFGTPDPQRPNISATIWRSLTDLTARIYAFESSFSPDIIWTHIDSLDFDKCHKLDLSQPNLVGDVTQRFVGSDPIEFNIEAA